MGPEGARPVSINVAEAKRRFSELIGRVAFGGATIEITRRGRPVARLVPAEAGQPAPHLADVRGWLEDDDPFFASLDKIERSRAKHRPRVLAPAPRSTRRKRR